MIRLARFAALVALILIVSSPTLAQTSHPAAAPAAAETKGDNAQELAKKLANPISDLVSVPFQSNWDAGIGPEKATRYLLNVQPVVPFSLTKNWNLIGRAITPIIGQPQLAQGGSATFGTGDLLMSGFFSPANANAVTWGVGPVVSLPTTSDPFLGSGKWCAGPTFVILRPSKTTVGALWNQVWSFADASNVERNKVNQMYFQPFVAYTTSSAFTFTLSSEATANWEAKNSSDTWTIPIILQLSKISSFGPFPASYGIAYGSYVDKPAGGPDWKLRMSFSILLPRKK